MPEICYIPKHFTKTSLAKIEKANQIIKEYAAQGFSLTLRQLYYQFVARDLIANNQKEYNNLGSLINNARLAGLIDWFAIIDRTRNLRSLPHWQSPKEIIDSCAAQYRRDKWEDQKTRIEVWIEKDALVGVIADICEQHDVAFFSCRGYISQSELWRAAQRFHRYLTDNLKPIILHLGDHDPSGLDMTHDIENRFNIFLDDAITQKTVEIRRLALNMEQIEQYNPPPNPTKLSDSRAPVYISQFGHNSWELDALEPSVITALIEKEIIAIKDDEFWQLTVEREQQERNELHRIRDNYDEVIEHFKTSRKKGKT